MTKLSGSAHDNEGSGQTARVCSGSSEPLLLADVIVTRISRAAHIEGKFIVRCMPENWFYGTREMGQSNGIVDGRHKTSIMLIYDNRVRCKMTELEQHWKHCNVNN